MSDAPEIFQAGADAGRAGRALPADAAPLYRQGWRIGDVSRRAMARELIAFNGPACKCYACGGVQYGMRLGCACWPMTSQYNPFTEEGQATLKRDGYSMHWGAFVLNVEDGRSIVFMPDEELRAAHAAGKAVVDALTAEPLEFD